LRVLDYLTGKDGGRQVELHVARIEQRQRRQTKKLDDEEGDCVIDSVEGFEDAC